MRFGVAFPNQVLGTTARDLKGFIDRVERLGFASVWTLDRIVYGGFSPIPLLAWAAGQTERVQLGTSVLLGTLRSPVLLAKDIATLDHLSGGRVILGLGQGSRTDDFAAVGVPMERRGRRAEETVALLRQVWSGQPVSFDGQVFSIHVGAVGPVPGRAGGPPLWLGGSDPRALQRAARLGDGYLAGGGGPAQAHRVIPAVRQLVHEAGRDPHNFPCACLAYFSVSGHLERDASNVSTYLERYYGRAIFNPHEAAVIGPTSQAAARLREYQDLDLDTLILVPTTSDPEQVDRLAEVVAEAGR